MDSVRAESAAGVKERAWRAFWTRFVDDDEDCDDDEREEPRYEKGTAPSDVFIVEGQQLRYGSKAAWRVASR